MNISNRLCNPTPFKIKWPYDKGVNLIIEPDGHIDLPVDIMDDFRSDKPGFEAVDFQMKQYGIFLKDPTRAYEHQAIETLEAYIETWTQTYNDCKNNMRRRASAQGTYDEKAFDETLKQMGYAAIMERVEQVKARLKIYQSSVSEERVVHQQFDPERTVLCLDPPKEFDSKIAMQIWLEEHPDVKAQHEAFMEAQENAGS